MRADGTTAHRAFSLVELLVAISIIALLLSILLPSVSKAREQARRVACGSHLRGLSNSWEIYGIGHRRLPPLSHYQTSQATAPEGIDINYRHNPATKVYEQIEVGGFGPETYDELIQSSGQQWASILYRNKIFHWSVPEWDGQWRNFGLLWFSKAVQNPRVFFCPSVRNPDLILGTRYNPWPPKAGYGGHPDHPMWVNHTNASYERRAGLTGVEWDRIGIQTTMVTDMMWPEDVRETHRDGINAAYRDGHVTYIRDRRFEDWWQDDSWARPESQRRFLEMSSWVDRRGTR